MIGSDRSPRKLSTPFNPIFLSRGDGIRSGGNLDDSSSEPVIGSIDFRGSVRAGAVLAFIVLWGRARSCWIRLDWN
jgi:hypothetical protein